MATKGRKTSTSECRGKATPSSRGHKREAKQKKRGTGQKTRQGHNKKKEQKVKGSKAKSWSGLTRKSLELTSRRALIRVGQVDNVVCYPLSVLHNSSGLSRFAVLPNRIVEGEDIRG